MSQVTIIESKEQLQQIQGDQDLVILYFSTEKCSVCHAVFPKLLDLVAAYPVSVIKIQADTLTEIAGQYLVFTVPTILVVQEGKELLRESRFIDYNNIDRILSLLYA
jgi:thioredoxin-like negative regulator of GroEL